MRNDAPCWPVLIRFSGDSELGFSADPGDWDRDSDRSSGHFVPGDLLIDSNGNTFSLEQADDGSIAPRQTGRRLDLAEMIELTRAHFSVLGECCTSKICPGSIDDCMRLFENRKEA